MKTLERKAFLCRFLYRKLDDIEKESSIGFSNSEKHFIKALVLLYKESEEHGNYFAKKYKTMTIRKVDKFVYEFYGRMGKE